MASGSVVCGTMAAKQSGPQLRAFALSIDAKRWVDTAPPVVAELEQPVNVQAPEIRYRQP
jgi:hypothetical protein